MILHPHHHSDPFPYFYVRSAFSVAQSDMLERVFLPAGDWQHRDTAFYQCALRDVTEEIPAAFLTKVISRMREITGLPLVNRIIVTAQRMMPGQAIGIHSDRPLLGYESARLVVQFNKQWHPDHGGILELFASSDGEVVSRVNPGYNEAFGFVLHRDSYHAVTEVTQPRQTLVFNFWHAANTPELATHVQALFANLHFSELPASLNTVVSAAEVNLPEDTTFRAGTAATALHRWGYDDVTVLAGYQYSAGLTLTSPHTSGTEVWAAIRLADWLACLYRDSFDLERWVNLHSELEGAAEFTRLMPTWRLCTQQDTKRHR
ncbi:MAG: 2OG-Fe(II) oxygenase family protein [Thiohalomonadales bacterium]